jgi:hypothetical protein
VTAKDSPIFVRRRDVLTLEEANYYQDLLYRTVKIGTELEFAMPKGVTREDFQPSLERLLAPSRDMNKLGRLGVFDIVKEHCGIEVQVIGRHPHWDALLKQYCQIATFLLENKVRIRPTCGLHYHLIGIGLAESLPEIILANLWNMARKYAPGLKYITSGGETWNGICRRRQHNAHQEFMRQSPIGLRMGDIQANLKNCLDVPEHQNFINLEHLRFDENGDIEQFHVEFRFPDADLSAIAITAKTFLFLAMLLKSVEISKFGLLHVGKIQDWKRKKEIMDLISNNDGERATSDTSGITPEVLEEYRSNALELLAFLKNVFAILDNPSEIVLHELAKLPNSLRRIAGDEWQKIDTDLGSKIPRPFLDRLDYKLVEIIELGLIEADDYDQWLKLTAIASATSKQAVEERIESYEKRKPTWEPKLRRVIFLR